MIAEKFTFFSPNRFERTDNLTYRLSLLLKSFIYIYMPSKLPRRRLKVIIGGKTTFILLLLFLFIRPMYLFLRTVATSQFSFCFLRFFNHLINHFNLAVTVIDIRSKDIRLSKKVFFCYCCF